MSAIVNVQIVLKDVRNENIENIMEAISYGLKLDAAEKDLLHQIFEINMQKLLDVSGNDIKNMSDLQIKYAQCELLLKIAKKLKLMMMSIEEHLGHEAIVNANFEYDEPQQRVWQEVQNYLNQLAASDGLNRVI